MSRFQSLDQKFNVRLTWDTLEPEEIPLVLASVGTILLECTALYESMVQRDAAAAGRSIVAIYDQLTRIKRELED